MRRLLVALIVLAALLVAADAGFRLLMERRVADRVADSIGVRDRPSVSIHGFPFLLHFVRGSFPSATVSGSDVETGAVTLGDVRLILREVRFPPGRMLRGEGGTIRARWGRGTFTMTDREVSSALREQGLDVSVTFTGGEVQVRSPQLPGEIAAELSVSDRTLTVRPSGAPVPLSLSLEIPPFVQGVSLEEVRIEDRRAVLSFRLEEPAFET